MADTVLVFCIQVCKLVTYLGRNISNNAVTGMKARKCYDNTVLLPE
jgi:hypothetical protein